jgi:glycosyltransferase involved in cell wall biosynthesis
MNGRVVHILEAMIGGTRRHLLDLLQGLPGWDQQAIISLGREPLQSQRFEGPAGRPIPVHIVSMQREIAPLSDARALMHIIELLRHIQPDIVHCHSAKAGILGRAAAVVAGVPTRIYTPHALPLFPCLPPFRRALYLALERLAGRWTTRLVAVSESEAQDARNARVVADDRIVVIPNGIQISAVAGRVTALSHPERSRDRRQARLALDLPPDRPMVLCVAHLRPQKAPGAWLHMATHVLSDAPGALFVWVGGGELERQFLGECQMLPAGSVRYVGSQDDPGPYYRAADIFALSSRWEGCPYALLEAMSWGLPCVATDVAGSRDAIRSGCNGILCPVDAPADMARAILSIMQAPSSLDLGMHAVETVREQYSMASFLEGHNRLYSELMGHV